MSNEQSQSPQTSPRRSLMSPLSAVFGPKTPRSASPPPSPKQSIESKPEQPSLQQVEEAPTPMQTDSQVLPSILPQQEFSENGESVLAANSTCASSTIPPNFGLVGCPFYQSSEISAELARQWLLPRGLVSVGLQSHSGPLTLHTFQLGDAYQVSFCQYFFVLRVVPNGDVIHVQLLDLIPPGTAAIRDVEPEPMDQSSATMSRTGTPLPKTTYSVGTKGFVLTKSKVAATMLREQLQASAATMACLLESELPSAGKRDSECAIKILHLLKECFLEITSYKYEVGMPSHKWSKVNGLDAKFLMQIASECMQIMKNEPTLLRLDPPVYVIGDLHGNYKDFAYFAKSFGLWSSAEFVPSRFLFLGDYVDRGLHSIETLAFVLALKVRFPDKIFLLRGNHECAEINGDEDLYLSGSFKTQCKLVYGVKDGEELWRAFNRCFDMMPLAAVIDKKVFCVHAGIPRFLARNPNCNILETIAAIPRPPNITDDLVFDLIWADPATLAEEKLIGLDGFPPGFGRNTRGPATCVFGKEAVRLFTEKSGCSHLIRAHQSPRLGVDISKNATILTVFSSSHYCGGYNRAASVLVHDSKLGIILSNPDADPEVIASNDDYRTT